MSLGHQKKKINQLFPYNMNFFHNLLQKYKEDEMKKANNNKIKIPIIKLKNSNQLNDKNEEETKKEININLKIINSKKITN